MEDSRWAPDIRKLSLTDDQEKDTLFTPLPTKSNPKPANQQQAPKTPANPSHKHKSDVKQETDAGLSNEDPREVALRAELASVRRINAVIEGVTASLEKAKSNMSTVNSTVSNAHSLLDTWTRILSQTEHNQRLILNPAWSGASQDVADAESEGLQRQREQERREQEEEQRRAQAEEKRRQEEERRRVEAEKRAASAGAVRGRSTSGLGVRGGRGVPGGRITSGARATSGAGASGRPNAPPQAAPSKPGRGAIAGYGRVGSVGTKAPRGRGRGVS